MAKLKDLPAVMPIAALSRLLGVSARQVQYLADRGIAVRAGRGVYDTAQTIARYVEHLRAQASGRVGQSPEVDPVAAAVQLRRVRIEREELRLRREAHELIEVGEVREGWCRIMRFLRGFVLALPGRIAFDIPVLTLTDRLRIEQICRDGLEDCALMRGFDAVGGPPATAEPAPSAPLLAQPDVG